MFLKKHAITGVVLSLHSNLLYLYLLRAHLELRNFSSKFVCIVIWCPTNSAKTMVERERERERERVVYQQETLG